MTLLPTNSMVKSAAIKHLGLPGYYYTDLGNRAFEVLHLPGHSPGCIALYDPLSQELFSGDIVYDGDLLDQLPGSDIPKYIATYDRLQRLPIETVYPGS